MNLLRRRRPLRDPTEVDFLEWTQVSAGDAATIDRSIEDVLEHRHSGFTVTDVLDPDEAARAASTFRHRADVFHMVGYGVIWGIPVNESWDGDRRAYLDRVDHTRELYAQVFGFDIVERLTTTFEKLSGRYGVTVASEGGRSYLPGSFREMRPGAGGLPAHTGNEFFEMGADGPLDHLAAVTDWRDSLSYFLMIEPPLDGGDLHIFDLAWEDRPDLRGFNNFDRDDRPFDSMATASLRAGPGDLVWFRGGDQWHKVTQIRGSRSRVTFGGFMAPTVSGDTLVYWS